MNKLFASVLLCATLLGSGILRADNIVISNRKSSILITAQKGESPRIPARTRECSIRTH